jgi:predicted dinucleotide-binding enzyme
MIVAVIGTGNIGKRVARDLVNASETVDIVNPDLATASKFATELGSGARAKTIDDALREADAVVFAVWFDVIKSLIKEHEDALRGKVVIDPSNAIADDGKGGFKPTLPEGQSAGAIIAGMLPSDAHYVKAFGTVAAEGLDAANRTPDRVVLFYATDDAVAEAAVRKLINAAGFEPVKAGGVRDAGRIEVFGDLHQYGGLGKLVSATEARDALKAGVTR